METEKKEKLKKRGVGVKGNRNYKDSVFTLLFQDKGKLIELYNAIEGTEYTADTGIEINTLETALYLVIR